MPCRGREREGGRGERERGGRREREGGERGREEAGREREGGREAADVDTLADVYMMRAPTGLNFSRCQRLG